MLRNPALLLIALLLALAPGCAADDSTGAATDAAATSSAAATAQPQSTNDGKPTSPTAEPHASTESDRREGVDRSERSPQDSAKDTGATATATRTEPSPAGSKDSGSKASGSRLEITGGPFERLSFGTVRCSAGGDGFFLQARSEDPEVAATILFDRGKAVQASLQTDADDRAIWSDHDQDRLADSVTRDGDVVTLTKAELAPFGAGDSLTVSGTLTCNERL